MMVCSTLPDRCRAGRKKRERMKSVSLTELYRELKGVRPVRIAHRGASGLYPENTLLAMRKALDLGADMIEFDLRLTKDGVPILQHDRVIDRNSTGKGEPALYTLEELRKFNFSVMKNEPVYESMRVATFEEVLEEFHDRVTMNIQVYVTSEPGLRTICSLYRKYEMFDRGFLAVGHEAARMVRRIDPEVEVAILGPSDQRALPEEIRRCAEFGCRFFQPFRDFLRPETFACAEELGMYGNVFFSDTDVLNRRLIAAGAAGILTNRMDLLRETCEALAAEQESDGRPI